MSTMPPFDAELLKRYDQPGPRYTSYPTAPQFTAAFGEAQLRRHAQQSNEEIAPRPISVYVHIPYCRSPCFYCGCNRLITRDPMKGTLYLSNLRREIALAAPLFARSREVVQLHLGGGTPNFLRPTQIANLVATLQTRFNLSEQASRDFSIELDPRFVEVGDIGQLAQLGFNRASFGIQDFAPQVQHAINRIQSIEQTLSAIADCRAASFRSVNVDLVYGLPRQTRQDFGRTLDTLLTVRPERFAVYGYAHLPHVFKAQRQIDTAELPNASEKLALLQLAVEQLEAAGYRHIGMDHFAVPEDDLSRARESGGLHRNFMGYTTHADCDLLGLGVSAISHIGASYSQNARELPEWEAAIDAGRLPVRRGLEMKFDDEIRAEVIQQLMCRGEIDIAAVERRYRIDFVTYFADALQRLEPLVGDGLATEVGGYISATPRGRFLLRVIAMCFDRYLHQSSAEVVTPRYSKVV
jgi:oxygen-independent coproporphyrinogen III oxidase